MPISSSRQKPESPRSTIFTSGHLARSCAPRCRSTSSSAPAAPSMLAGLSRAHQQLIAGEDIERQVAVAVVVAMKKSFRLMAIDRDGIVVSDSSTIWSGAWACDSMNRSKQHVDLLRHVIDLVIALATARKLQPVQRTLAGQWLFQISPPMVRQCVFFFFFFLWLRSGCVLLPAAAPPHAPLSRPGSEAYRACASCRAATHLAPPRRNAAASAKPSGDSRRLLSPRVAPVGAPPKRALPGPVQYTCAAGCDPMRSPQAGFCPTYSTTRILSVPSTQIRTPLSDCELAECVSALGDQKAGRAIYRPFCCLRCRS